MSTAGAIVDRLYRTYLYPPDARPAQAQLGTTLSDSDTSVIFGAFVISEDETLLTTGSQIEIASELMQITSYDELTTTATVTRAVGGTTAAAHTSGDWITIAPAFTRQSAFESVADNIQTLYPMLFTVQTSNLSSVAPAIFDIEDGLAVQVVEVWSDTLSSSQDIDARIVDFHPAVGGRALITNVSVGTVWVKYRRRFGDAASEADTFLSLGMEERWVNIVMAGAGADLMSGRDISSAQSDWVGAVLEAESVPIGTRGSIARNLAGYREHLIEKARKEMRAEYRGKIHTKPANQVVTRSAWG